MLKPITVANISTIEFPAMVRTSSPPSVVTHLLLELHLGEDRYRRHTKYYCVAFDSLKPSFGGSGASRNDVESYVLD